jgi:hypothetical protein
MKIDSDTFVCMICLAAFIGYTLGVRNMVNNTVKPQQCHKVTQTNLSDLADILTSSHLMINNLQKSTIMPMITPQTESTPIIDNDVCESFMVTTNNVHNVVSTAEEDKVDSIETSASSENYTDNNNKMLSPIILNHSEEEYEVILGNVKKNDTTKGIKTQYYFGWFDSMF